MKAYYQASVLFGLLWFVHAGRAQVLVKQSGNGFKLEVDGQDFMIKGMNWDYYPIGTNYTYSLWSQPKEIVQSVLDEEMQLAQNMGVNALRIYKGIPKKWIEYIYKNFGIYTMLNHPFGRYGLTIDGDWRSNTAYDDPRVKALLLEEAAQLVKEYKDTPGLLLYLLGNENNYGLFYEDAEKEGLKKKGKSSALETRAMYKLFLLNNESNAESTAGEQAKSSLTIDQKAAGRARPMYKLFNEAALMMKALDSIHPIAICNGDLMFIDIIKEECTEVDIFGTNIYRGISFGDTFQRVKEDLNKPILFTEVGADAYNVIASTEDQESQAYYTLGNWKEIYANAAGMGGAENSIGGFTFQFSDGWWKFDQTQRLDVHDSTATWNNRGYFRDEKDGLNNMNEEWFGVCAKVQTDTQEAYQLLPRAAYFVLKEAHEFSPYDTAATLVELEKHFSNIEIFEAIKASKDYSASLVKGN
ncbi:MAG: hypothetical protein RIF33_10650 [Cyclobacteriaceae bacterium]